MPPLADRMTTPTRGGEVDGMNFNFHKDSSTGSHSILVLKLRDSLDGWTPRWVKELKGLQKRLCKKALEQQIVC